MRLDESTFERLTRNEADIAFRRRVRTVLEWLELAPGATLLDCGSGRGFYLRILRALLPNRLVGVERDERALAHARRNLAGLHDITLVRGSALALPFPDRCFDAVLLSEVLEHLPDESGGLAEVSRVLKPGGTAIVTVPHAAYPFLWDPMNRTLEHLLATHIARGPLAGIWANHLRLYTPERLRALAVQTGFAVTEQRSFTRRCLPFSHVLLYGLGMPLLDNGLLPRILSGAADRARVEGDPPGRWNPVRLAVSAFQWFDRFNRPNEPAGTATVNLAARLHKPARDRAGIAAAAR